MTTDDQQIPVFIEISIIDWCVCGAPSWLNMRSPTHLYCLHFNGHFPGETGLAHVYWSKGWWKWWWQLELQVVQSSSRIITTNKPTPSFFYRPDAVPVAQPTVSKHWREQQPTHSYYLHNTCSSESVIPWMLSAEPVSFLFSSFLRLCLLYSVRSYNLKKNQNTVFFINWHVFKHGSDVWKSEKLQSIVSCAFRS